MNCDKASLLLYAVTDRSWLHGQTLYEQAEQALQGGATFLQLREKELDEAHFKEEAVALKALCRQYGVPFVLDDNVAPAIETDADAARAAEKLLETGLQQVYISLGGDGLYAADRQGHIGHTVADDGALQRHHGLSGADGLLHLGCNVQITVHINVPPCQEYSVYFPSSCRGG